MSKAISKVAVKLEMNEVPFKSEDSALNLGGVMINGDGRKRDRTAMKREDTQVMKKQKILKDPCDPMLGDCFPRDVSETSVQILPKDLPENLDNAVSSQSSESDDESDDEFDPWAEIFASTYDLNSGLGREPTPPRSNVEGDHLTWAQRYLSSV